VLLLISWSAAAVANQGQSPQPATAIYYPFIGKWKGHAQLAEPGKPAIKITMTVSCHKVSAGWAVECSMNAKNKKMQACETDLMGIDPVTGKGHWYAITNMGETYAISLIGKMLTPWMHTIAGSRMAKPCWKKLSFL
jgi:hypothetical protein